MNARDFDPTEAGGLIRQLSIGRLKVTDRGIGVVTKHIARFGDDEANQIMVDRLRLIARSTLEPTRYDLNFYAHELREFVRYRRRGFPTGAGDDYDLWNNTHAATLRDYRLDELDMDKNRNLFHPDAWVFFP